MKGVHMHAFFYLRPSMARKKTHTLPIQLVELEDQNYHILIETSFQHMLKGKWVIDTGASKTVFDLNQLSYFELSEEQNPEIRSAGIGEGHIETQTGILPLLKLGDAELINWPVAIIDLGHINELYQQFTNENIVGLLGSDFLVQHRARIDFRKLTFTFYL